MQCCDAVQLDAPVQELPNTQYNHKFEAIAVIKLTFIALPSLLEKAIAARLTRLNFPGFGYIFEFILENKASNLDLVIVSVFCFDYCFLRVMEERYIMFA
ncbi:hypothetical protein [Nostoc sp. 'Peltigera membranacea cyanobiont' 210A]|uniref:hypothetical protein n=1 Tax=Nostoc sp. 'Peltigera membranacea cyanobiont' 210A TaxID=2014529 RepID=UPI00117C41F9|nr:hypothetical protein [Nostoc sp. 'Peltigera membranacea cyanobiont' 210A]